MTLNPCRCQTLTPNLNILHTDRENRAQSPKVLAATCRTTPVFISTNRTREEKKTTDSFVEEASERTSSGICPGIRGVSDKANPKSGAGGSPLDAT